MYNTEDGFFIMSLLSRLDLYQYLHTQTPQLCIMLVLWFTQISMIGLMSQSLGL